MLHLSTSQLNPSTKQRPGYIVPVTHCAGVKHPEAHESIGCLKDGDFGNVDVMVICVHVVVSVKRYIIMILT